MHWDSLIFVPRQIWRFESKLKIWVTLGDRIPTRVAYAVTLFSPEFVSPKVTEHFCSDLPSNPNLHTFLFWSKPSRWSKSKQKYSVTSEDMNSVILLTTHERWVHSRSSSQLSYERKKSSTKLNKVLSHLRNPSPSDLTPELIHAPWKINNLK